MPGQGINKLLGGGGGSTPTPSSGARGIDRLRNRPAPAPTEEPVDATGASEFTLPMADDSSSWTPGLVGAGLVAGAAALATRRPDLAKGVLGKLGKYAEATRMTSMLSGLAAPKSMLGNVGAAVNSAAERGTMKPLKEFFSRQTAKDWWNELRNPTEELTVNPEQYGPGAKPVMNPFGRLMGAGDTATRRALVRSGETAEGAAKQTLQTPLPKAVSEKLDSPVGRFIVPFRRTPINQALEGVETLKFTHPKTTAAHIAAGAVTGALTSDDQFPVPVGLHLAAAGRYAVPAGIGALAGRYLAGGKGKGGIVGNLLPVSEYGVEQSLTDPTAPFREPAMVRAIDRLLGSK